MGSPLHSMLLRAITIKGDRTIASHTEADVAVRVDQAGQCESSWQVFRVWNWAVAPSVRCKPTVVGCIPVGQHDGVYSPARHLYTLRHVFALKAKFPRIIDR